jgi:hypothetical protein
MASRLSQEITRISKRSFDENTARTRIHVSRTRTERYPPRDNVEDSVDIQIIRHGESDTIANIPHEDAKELLNCLRDVLEEDLAVDVRTRE